MEEELDLLELWHIISRRWKMIVLLTVLAAVLSALVTIFLIKPKYVASSSLMVVRQMESEQIILYQDVQVSRQLADTYQVIARSRRVLDRVIASLNLPFTYEQMQKKISVSPMHKTEVIAIDVTDTDPYLAASISNKVADIFMHEIKNIMNMDNVSLIDKATVPEKPVSPRKRLNVAIAMAIGFMAAIVLSLLQHYLDQTIKSPEEVQELLGLTVLGNIPVMEDI